MEGRLKAKCISLEHEISDLKKQNTILDNQLEMEKIKNDNDRKKIQNLQEQLQDKVFEIFTCYFPRKKFTTIFQFFL